MKYQGCIYNPRANSIDYEVQAGDRDQVLNLLYEKVPEDADPNECQVCYYRRVYYVVLKTTGLLKPLIRFRINSYKKKYDAYESQIVKGLPKENRRRVKKSRH